MNRSEKKQLIRYIRQLLHLEKDIIIIADDGLIHLEVKGNAFYIYIKSLTYGGNPYPPNTTRAQLPRRDEFEPVIASEAFFLFLGYDEQNKTFVCWDPVKTKERLNKKSYVSFFSRLNLQESAKQGKLIEAYLENGLKYVLFNINDLAYFLLNIQSYFPEIHLHSESIAISESVEGVLLKVEDDKSVKLLIDELYKMKPDISTLKLMAECMNEFGVFYHRMTLTDWRGVINKYINSLARDTDFEDNIYIVAESDD